MALLGTILILISGILANVYSKANVTPDTAQNARMLINLLDYIGKDYSNAVQDGQIINEYEYEEMLEFSRQSKFFYGEISESVPRQDSLNNQFDSLLQMIVEKSDSKFIAELAAQIKREILALNLVEISPDIWPSVIAGQKLYMAQCSSCHGEKGDGKGLATAGLEPAPTNFTDVEIMNAFSPFQAYNVIQTGIPGTSMISYSELNDKEIWDLAFYINSIQFEEKNNHQNPEIPLAEVSSLTNNELTKKYNLDEEDVRALRLFVPSQSMSALAIARQYLDATVESYRKGEKEEARNNSLKAYLEGIEPVEHRIKASDNSLVNKLEKSMMDIRSAIYQNKDVKEIESLTLIAYANIEKADEIISGQKNSIGFTAFMSASILLREGLEAFLIIIAIISILRSMQANKAVRWVHSGWITAVVVGIGSWFFTDQLISWGAQSRELMEGAIALFAVFVLIYIGFWMHRKTEMSRWKIFVEEKVKGLVKRNNLIGLAVFSFMVVFREAFESVIFLSSWSLESGKENEAGIWSGVAIAATLLVLICWTLLRFINRIPLRQFFVYFSLVVVFMATILAGEGVHALQESGYSTVTSLPFNLRLGVFGIYPTIETLLAQFAVIGLVIFLWKLNLGSSKVKKPAK
jgi:high-affinity iron transporter